METQVGPGAAAKLAPVLNQQHVMCSSLFEYPTHSFGLHLVTAHLVPALTAHFQSRTITCMQVWFERVRKGIEDAETSYGLVHMA